MKLIRTPVLVTTTAAAAMTWAAHRSLRSGRLGRDARWQRQNFAGESVSLLEGLAVVLGSSGAALAGRLAGASSAQSGAAVVAAALPGAVGAWDDLNPDAERKGLAGHLGALRTGELTTGSIKIIVLTASGVITAALQPTPAHRGRAGRCFDVLVGGALVAGSANLANLFDLRPGRALKVAALVATPLALGSRGSASAGAVLGSAIAALPDDLAGRTMLGDTGANPVGALAGLAVLQRCGSAGRMAALAVVTGLTLASERVSFTAVIESTPGLREWDRWGRR